MREGSYKVVKVNIDEEPQLAQAVRRAEHPADRAVPQRPARACRRSAPSRASSSKPSSGCSSSRSRDREFSLTIPAPFNTVPNSSLCRLERSPRPTRSHLFGARRSDPARDRPAPGPRLRVGERARRTVRDVAASRAQARRDPRGRGPRAHAQGGARAALRARTRADRRRGAMDRRAPPALGTATRPDREVPREQENR